MTNSHDYRYRWRFTARALCLFDGEARIGEPIDVWSCNDYRGHRGG